MDTVCFSVTDVAIFLSMSMLLLALRWLWWIDFLQLSRPKFVSISHQRSHNWNVFSFLFGSKEIERFCFWRMFIVVYLFEQLIIHLQGIQCAFFFTRQILIMELALSSSDKMNICWSFLYDLRIYLPILVNKFRTCSDWKLLRWLVIHVREWVVYRAAALS